MLLLKESKQFCQMQLFASASRIELPCWGRSATAAAPAEFGSTRLIEVTSDLPQKDVLIPQLGWGLVWRGTSSHIIDPTPQRPLEATPTPAQHWRSIT